MKLGIDPAATPAICCGPNIVNFSKIASLEEMVGHIYGRTSLLANSARPHVFLRELAINIDFLCKELKKYQLGIGSYTLDYFEEFRDNLLGGIDHYRRFADRIKREGATASLVELERLQMAVAAIPIAADETPSDDADSWETRLAS